MELNCKAGISGLEDDADLQFLLRGGELVKVRSSSWQKNRFYKLQEDCKTMWYKSNSTFKSDPTFSIDDIDSVRKGRKSEGLQKYTDPSTEECCFSIHFKGRKKPLDLMAFSADEAKQWVSGLDKIIRNMRILSPQQTREHWIFSCMRKADKNGDNKMTLKELKHFLRQINVEVDDTYAAELFNKCDTSNSGTLEDLEIKHFYEVLTHRHEIDVIYGKYAQTAGQMSATDLLNFLLGEQREQVSMEDAVRLIDKYELDETAKQKKHMSKDGFQIYMQQEESSIFNPEHKQVHQDMSQPLNHYYISSSHNTYLMEDQLKGPSSTEAYIRALMKSCRCVELDCWDGANGEPVIYHGYTLTSKVLFEDVIKAIKDYAFKTSDYPVILSLENHCSMEQQKLMAKHLSSILGSALLTKPLGETMPNSFPSPEELKRRFLVKGKRLNKLEAAYNNNSNAEVDSVSEEDEAEEFKENDQKAKAQKKKIKLAKELSDIVVYCKSVHFSGFEHAKKNQVFYEMSSFKESKAFNLAKTSATAYIHHNMDKLSRIYPAGSRTDSSNYNPVPIWNAGCQIVKGTMESNCHSVPLFLKSIPNTDWGMYLFKYSNQNEYFLLNRSMWTLRVALNFQTPCIEMDLNQGRFLPNGTCGYILKPEFQRDQFSQFNPNSLTQGPWLQKKVFHVMVISAQQLPKVNKDKHNSIVDPLVRVEIYGVPADNTSKETHHIENNGFNPMWNQSFQFDIRVPELAMVRFVVEDHDVSSQNDLVGQYCLPLTSVQNGYRHVPLLTKRGNIISSAGLFVHLMLINAQ